MRNIQQSLSLDLLANVTKCCIWMDQAFKLFGSFYLELVAKFCNRS
jgi:hypothetical protein